MADQGGGGGGDGDGGGMREYRKGNWTVGETMVLIEAKQMDDERRMKRSSGGDQQSEGRVSKPTELRWKWVEDYCWRKGCLRSQNQCNDKWDNLMRDYKKVRDYERKVAESEPQQQQQQQSYWKMEKNERKDRNLPSNMLFQIYEALVGVVEKKGSGQRVMVSGSASYPHVVIERPLTLLHHHHSLPPHIPLPPPPPQPHVADQPPQSHQSDSDTSGYSDSPAKRRRRYGGEGASESASASHEVGTAISKSAAIIAEALQASEEREERRHKDLVSLHERRLQIEKDKTEINKEGINGLVDAINKLANSILVLASKKSQQSSSSSPPS
ncbi:trihelix transcription factor ASR3-like [Mangifera indica]|uniref:trihelix transcription factor ASR3-like n=1 Tax=Mangifera indica TaxID=29780 RepID=UPI001CF9A922|nr:trihelix transcription factor ASR3-like [Mangifera indica]